MQVVDQSQPEKKPIFAEFRSVIPQARGAAVQARRPLERFAFYDRVKQELRDR